jgi:hypothetical protein
VYRGRYDRPNKSTLTGKLVFPPRSSFVDAIARRDKLRVIVDGMTAANDLGLTTAVPAQSTIYADTYPREIAIEVYPGDLKDQVPVVYRLDFKRIAAKTAFWAGRPAMRVIQALDWFKDNRSNDQTLTDGIARYLERTPRRNEILEDLRANKQTAPAWMYPLIEMILANTESHSTCTNGLSKF